MGMDNQKIVIVVAIFIIFLTISIYLITRSKLEHIRENWDQYRCKPWVIPLAKIYNPCVDPVKNAQECHRAAMEKITDAALKPMHSTFNTIIDSVQGLANNAEAQSNFSNGRTNALLDFVNQFIEKMGGVGDVMRYSLIKIRAILNKMLGLLQISYNIVIGIAMSLVWIWEVPRYMLIIFVSTVLILALLGCFFFPLLCKFVFMIMSLMGVHLFCFDQDTPILMKDGSTKPIKDIRVGDQLWGTLNGGKDNEGMDEGENRVTATLRLSSKGQKMYRYRGTIVSGSHIVWHHPSRTWREVAHCPEAEALQEYQRDTIYCLETTTHQFISSQSGDSRFTVYRDYQGMEFGDPIRGLSQDTVVYVPGGTATIDILRIGSRILTKDGDLQRVLAIVECENSTRHFITSRGHLVVKEDEKILQVIDDYMEGNSPHLEKKTDRCILELLNSRLF